MTIIRNTFIEQKPQNKIKINKQLSYARHKLNINVNSKRRQKPKQKNYRKRILKTKKEA